MISLIHLTDTQVRTLLDAYQRPRNEVMVEQPVTVHRLRAMGMVEFVSTDAGCVPVLSEKGKDMVWGWHNPIWVNAA